MTIASESGHWYTRDGEPAYTVKGANGKERPTTLRDARKLGLVPSVTGIIRAAGTPFGLVNYFVEQAIMSSLTLPRREGEPDDDYIARIRVDAEVRAETARNKGTAIHAAIEQHYAGELPSEDMWPYVKGASAAVKAWREGGMNWEPEKSFASPRGYGGKVDLHSRDNEGWLVDFKSTDKCPLPDRTFDEHWMQSAGYMDGVGIAFGRAAICYVSTSNPGEARIVEITKDELEKGWAMFKALLQFWQAKTGYATQS